MTASNHAVAGVLIAVHVGQPVFAVPLAFASHFVLDAAPHFGNYEKITDRTSKNFKRFLAMDIALLALIALGSMLAFAEIWPLVFLCVFASISPDLMWLPYYIRDLRGEPKALGPIASFHKKIQWAEIPMGWVTEAIFIAVGAAIIIRLAAA